MPDTPLPHAAKPSTLTFTMKDFLYVCVLVVGIALSYSSVKATASEALDQAQDNEKQIEANSEITAGYDVIIVQLNAINSRLNKIESKLENRDE